MFRSPSRIAALLILFLSISWISYLSFFKKEALSTAQKSRLQQSLSDSAISTTTQSRKNVRKDIWISQPNHQRLQNRIDSKSSLLTLTPDKGSTEIIEQLQDIQCWSQEKIYSTGRTFSHQLRLLQAEKGNYSYKTQTFEASNASLSLCKIQGLSLPSQPESHEIFLKGTAAHISFAVESGVPLFKADQFNASLSQGGK